MEGNDVNLYDEIKMLHKELQSRKVITNTLQSELDSKNARILLLQDDLASKNACILELHDKLDKSCLSMNELKQQLEKSNSTVFELKGELFQKSIQLSETESLKRYHNESFKRIAFLEKCLNEKNIALELRKRLIESLRCKFNQEVKSAFIRQNKLERNEQIMQSSQQSAIRKLVPRDSGKVIKKELCSDCSLKESSLEDQIAKLYLKISALDKRDKSHKEEYNKMLCKLKKLFKNCQSQISEMDHRLAIFKEVRSNKESNPNLDNTNAYN